jgi:hypothetical protein
MKQGGRPTTQHESGPMRGMNVIDGAPVDEDTNGNAGAARGAGGDAWATRGLGRGIRGAHGMG